MNKNQLIVAWVMGVLISLICVYPPVRTKMDISHPNPSVSRIYIFSTPFIGIVDLGKVILEIIPILVIGGLVIYTLRVRTLREEK